MLLCVLFLYIWVYITDCIFVFCIFYLAAFKRHYALRLAIAPEFFYCSYMCLFYVCALGCWNKICMYVCMHMNQTELDCSSRTAGLNTRFQMKVFFHSSPTAVRGVNASSTTVPLNCTRWNSTSVYVVWTRLNASPAPVRCHIDDYIIPFLSCLLCSVAVVEWLERPTAAWEDQGSNLTRRRLCSSRMPMWYAVLGTSCASSLQCLGQLSLTSLQGR